MKLLFKSIGILIVMGALLLGAAWLFSPRIAAHVIGRDLGTRAEVDHFRVGLHETSFGGITIFSPPGSRVDPALTVKSGSATASAWGAVGADPYVIERLAMKDLDLRFDFPMGPSLKSGNWGRMLAYSDAHADPQGRETVIRELILENVNVSMVGADGKTTTLKPISRLRLTNVSSKTGVQKSELMGLIFTQIISQVLSLENLLPAIEQAAMKGLNEASTGAKAALSEAAGDLKKGLGGLFGGEGSGAANPPSQP